MPDRSRHPHDLLPLTPVVFEILLSLADRQRHGYAVMLEVERRTAGATKLRPGTLYRALNRLVDAGIVAEVDERPDPARDDHRRRYYRLTAFGRQVAAAEAARLADAVEAARVRRLLTEHV